jgi:hypothetical protein
MLMNINLAQFSIPLPDRKIQEEIATAIDSFAQTRNAPAQARPSSPIFRTLLRKFIFGCRTSTWMTYLRHPVAELAMGYPQAVSSWSKRVK